MGLYEQIVGANKKKDEEKILGFADNIINSTKVDVNKRYETQKQVVDSISRDLQSALYKENQKNGLFTTPVIPTKKASDFINSAMYKKNPESKENGNEYNPYDVKENAEKFRKSLEATKDISDKLSAERNTLKYDKYLKTAEDVNNEKTTLWDKTGGVVVRGLADLGSSFTIEERKYKDENGNTVFLPSYNTLKQQKVSEDYNTKVGKILGDIGYNTTKILGSTALNAVTGGIGGSALYWQDMAVDNYTNAINQGYEGANAAAYSLVSTGLEYAVGKVLGGATSKLTGGSMRELDTALSNAMNKVIANPTLARIIGTGGSEFTEEFVQEYLDNINKLLILEENTNAKDYVSVLTNPEVLGDALYSGLVGFASGGLVEATNGSDVNRNIKMFQTFKEQLEQRKSLTTDIKTIEQYDGIIQTIDNYIKNPFSINTNAVEETQNNINNLPTIEEATESSSSRKALESLQEQNDANLQALLEQQRTLNESKLQEIENEEQRIKNQQLLEETNKRIAELEAEMKELVPTANTEGMNLQESAERYGLNANSTPVKTIQLMLENRGINARFDSTPFKNSSTNAIWSKDGNGNRSVIFNPKASPDTVLENIAIHELTHDLMSSVDSRKALRTDDLLSYVKSLEGYQEARNDLIHTYSAMYNPNSDSFQSLIDEEVVADVLGRRLGNQEFVTRLVNQKPSIARSIYNWVVDKLNSIVNRGGNVRNEKLYWESLKNRFENAYNMSYNSNTEAGTRYAKSSDIAREVFPNDATVEDLINDDPRKSKFKKWSNSLEYFKLPYEVMDEINAVVSGKAHHNIRGNDLSFVQQIEADKKVYTIYADIFTDNNYSIINAEELKEISEEVAHETNPNKNSKYFVENATNNRGTSNVDSKSTGYRRTSEGISTIPTNKQGTTNKQGINKESSKSSREELDNSSFSNVETRYSKEAKEWNEFLDKNINEDSQEKRIAELKDRYDGLDKTREVTFDERDSLRKELNDLIRSDNYKNAESKFKEMIKSNMTPDEISKTNEYKIMEQEEKIRKKLREYDADVKFMTEEMSKISEMIEQEEKQHRNPQNAIKEAKKIFGITKDYREAGYMLQDGSLLDFSGRNQGSNNYGQRGLDHRDINEIGYDMDEFIELGNIRMKPEAPGFEMNIEPTTEQYNELYDYIEYLKEKEDMYPADNSYINIDVDIPGTSRYNTALYKIKTPTNKIINDIKEYYKTGEFPKQSEFADFYYSISKKDGQWDKWVKNNIESEGTTTRLGDIKLPTKQQPKNPTKQVAKKPTTNQTKLLPTQPIKKETQKTTIPMAKKDDVIKVASQKIAKQINSTGGFDLKQRSWVGTSTESEILKDKVYIDDLDVKKINYVVQSNKKSLDNANNRLKNNGYEKTLDYVKSIMQSDKLPSASDVALMQRMIQEASKKGDAETVQDLIMNTAIIGTDLGQATQALSIIQRLTPEGQLKMYTKLVQRAKSRGEKSFQNVEITPEMVQNVLEAYKKDGTYDQDDLNNRVEKFKQSIANQMKTTAGEKIDAWRYLSMLGNPKTHIRNMVSNVAMRGTIKVKNAMARTLETILPVKDRTKTWKKASNEVQNFAEQTANEMKGIITGENKYNEKSSIESKKQIFKNKALEKISNFNSNALEAEDWFFSKKTFKDTLQEYLTAKGINTKVDIENNSELVEKAKLYAVEQAEIATFRQYSKLASMIGQFQRKSKFGRIAVEALMPFKKTPVNVAKAGVSYSPIGLLKNISYDVYQLKQGNINASQFIDNLAQGLTGTSLTLLGYALAKSGVLSGSGGDDKDDKYDKQLGKTGYSLNIGGNSYSISWLSPVAMPLLVGSNAYEQLEEDKEWDMNVVSDTLAKTLDPLNEMSFMQGLTNALQSYGSGADKIKGSLESTAQNYVGQFFPTLFSQLAATTDDKKRSTKASNNSSYKFGEQTIRSIMYKVPGLRQQLEVATDIWGNEKEQSENILQRAFESFIAPYSKNKDISTNLDKEIKRVYNETGESGVIPNIPYAYTKYDGETYKMSAKEYTDFKKTYGQTANSTLNKLINSADYKEATDEDKAKMIDSVYDYARAKANEEYFDNSDTNYENKMIDKLDTLKSNYGISADTYFANKKEYDYAYQNPDKYSVIRQIAKYDKYTTYKNEITDIRNNTSNDKIETIKYINSLNMNIPQKAMFIKQYYKSFKQYDSQIIQYINNQKLTSKEKEQILTQLGFTIKDGRVYY